MPTTDPCREMRVRIVRSRAQHRFGELQRPRDVRAGSARASSGGGGVMLMLGLVALPR